MQSRRKEELGVYLGAIPWPPRYDYDCVVAAAVEAY
jgi:hypothetical protein